MKLISIPATVRHTDGHLLCTHIHNIHLENRLSLTSYYDSLYF